VHNSQPWRWRVVDDATIELYADRRRQLQVSEPSGRNSTLSCGAAVHHGFVAAQALGLAAAIELMPLSDGEGLFARISLSSGTRTVEALESLKLLKSGAPTAVASRLGRFLTPESLTLPRQPRGGEPMPSRSPM